MNSIGRKILTFSIILSLTVGFGAGVGFSRYETFKSLPIISRLINQESSRTKDVDFALFWQVWAKLNDKYVDKNKLDPQKLVYGAIEGMVNTAGDPYTVFFEPVVSKKFQEEIAGQFGGVGIEVGKKGGILTVIAPVKDTPAFKAGIKAGDKILKIDSKSTADMAIDEAVNMIRGKMGTKVVLTIATIGQKGTKDIALIRDAIKIPTVEWKLINDHIAYIQVFSFNENVDSLFKDAAQEILKSKADSIILDLRNNPGGLLDSAINLAGWFLDKDSLVTSEVFGNGTKNDFKTDGNAAFKTYRVAILINGGSASASEILSGALHDDRQTKLVGEKSFGKGSVQELEHFEGGSSLKVTVAKWLTPAGISISEKGIEPDVKIELTEEDVKKEDFHVGDAGHDPQLDKAIEVIK